MTKLQNKSVDTLQNGTLRLEWEGQELKNVMHGEEVLSESQLKECCFVINTDIGRVAYGRIDWNGDTLVAVFSKNCATDAICDYRELKTVDVVPLLNDYKIKKYNLHIHTVATYLGKLSSGTRVYFN